MAAFDVHNQVECVRREGQTLGTPMANMNIAGQRLWGGRMRINALQCNKIGMGTENAQLWHLSSFFPFFPPFPVSQSVLYRFSQRNPPPRPQPISNTRTPFNRCGYSGQRANVCSYSKQWARSARALMTAAALLLVRSKSEANRAHDDSLIGLLLLLLDLGCENGKLIIVQIFP